METSQVRSGSGGGAGRMQPDIGANLLDEILTWKKLELLESTSVQAWLADAQSQVLTSQPQYLTCSLEQAIARERSAHNSPATAAIASPMSASVDDGIQQTTVSLSRTPVSKPHPLLPSTSDMQMVMDRSAAGNQQQDEMSRLESSLMSTGVRQESATAVALSTNIEAMVDTNQQGSSSDRYDDVENDGREMAMQFSNEPHVHHHASDNVTMAEKGSVMRVVTKTGVSNKLPVSKEKYPLLIGQLMASDAANPTQAKTAQSILHQLDRQQAGSTSSQLEAVESARSKQERLSIQSRVKRHEQECTALSALDLASLLSSASEKLSAGVTAVYEPLMTFLNPSSSDSGLSDNMTAPTMVQSTSMINMDTSSSSYQTMYTSPALAQQQLVSTTSALPTTATAVTSSCVPLSQCSSLNMDTAKVSSRSVFRAQSAPTVPGNPLQHAGLLISPPPSPQQLGPGVAPVPGVAPAAGMVSVQLAPRNTMMTSPMDCGASDPSAAWISGSTPFDDFAIPAPPTSTFGIYCQERLVAGLESHATGGSPGPMMTSTTTVASREQGIVYRNVKSPGGGTSRSASRTHFSPIAPKVQSKTCIGLNFQQQQQQQQPGYKPIYPKTLEVTSAPDNSTLLLTSNTGPVLMGAPQINPALHSGLPQLQPGPRVTVATATPSSTTQQSEGINWQWHMVQPNQRSKPRSVNRGNTNLLHKLLAGNKQGTAVTMETAVPTQPLYTTASALVSTTTAVHTAQTVSATAPAGQMTGTQPVRMQEFQSSELDQWLSRDLGQE